MNWIGILVAASLLGLIPASIASKKGRDFSIWWLYGTLIFIVALIHAIFLEDYSGSGNANMTTSSTKTTADVLLKFKEALDIEAVTQEEYVSLSEYYKNVGDNKL
ncbi:MAG: hypothetical protein IKO10_02475 [Lachnospiraceae bacterium]|nr:hypothetical protein [Lachnospiraceae bacterium]